MKQVERKTPRKSIRLRHGHLYALTFVSAYMTLVISPWNLAFLYHGESMDQEASSWMPQDRKSSSAGIKKPIYPQNPRALLAARTTPLPVYVWSNPREPKTTAVRKHLMENGIAESPCLQRVDDWHNFTVSDPFAFVADASVVRNWTLYCEDLLEMVQRAKYQTLQNGNVTSISQEQRFHVYIVDYKDSAKLLTCPHVDDLLGKQYVHYSTRSIAKGRRWLPTRNRWDVGKKLNLTTTDGTTFQHTPMMVRTDTVETLQGVLQQNFSQRLANTIEALSRPLDVTHFWPSQRNNTKHSKLRARVSQIVEEVGQAHHWNTFVGLQGQVARMGRQSVATEYIETLLKSKIVVVTQRDSWEDHYRLMEALVSGACVVMDFMHGLPAGLQNGTSVVVFTTEEELRSLLVYYLEHEEERLAIAREGRRIAMSRHRTWHRMEEIIFGQALSTCSEKDDTSSQATAKSRRSMETEVTSTTRNRCPWQVHANETSLLV